MRIVDHIPHQSMSISIFHMNDKYQVKFEAGPMEQTFKFLVEDVKSIEGLKQKINADFIESVRLRFNDMFLQMKAL
jgi:alkyl hydroperoxide reductase subunit AhpF